MGEGADALMRGQEATGQGRDSVAKLSQIIQVCYRAPVCADALVLKTVQSEILIPQSVELFHESCSDNPPRKIFIATCVRERFRYQKA